MEKSYDTVEDYLASLPEERRSVVGAVRSVILKSLPKGYEEGIQYGMIGYFVPHSLYPNGYHCDPKQPLPFLGLASQKNYYSLYFMGVYGDPEEVAWLQREWAKTGKKLDMGRCCIRFRKLEDLPLDVLGKAIKRIPVRTLIRRHEEALETRKRATRKPK